MAEVFLEWKGEGNDDDGWMAWWMMVLTLRWGLVVVLTWVVMLVGVHNSFLSCVRSFSPLPDWDDVLRERGVAYLPG